MTEQISNMDIDKKPTEAEKAIVYICESCYEGNHLKPGDAIKCRSCGNRILYKKRTRRMMIFDARWREWTKIE